jgi:hypothetical protein
MTIEGNSPVRKNTNSKMESLETVETIIKEAFFNKEIKACQFMLFVDSLIVLRNLKKKIRNEKSEKMPKLISELIPLKHLLKSLKDDEEYIIRNESSTNKDITIMYLGHENGPEDAIIKTPKKEIKVDVTLVLDKDKEIIFPKKENRCFDMTKLGEEIAEDILERVKKKIQIRGQDFLLLIVIQHRVRMAFANGEIAFALDVVREKLNKLNIKHKIIFIINNTLVCGTEVIDFG